MPSTVVATILFTDLVDSTALSSRLSAEAAEALRQTHFGLLRAAIQVTGGVEVKNLGDGLTALLERVPKVGLDDDRVGPAIERARQAARTYGYAGIERRARALLGETS